MTTVTGSTDPTREQVNIDDVQSHKLKMHLLACGYLRKYFLTKNTNPKDIGYIIGAFLAVDWKFDYFYDYFKRGASSELHGIYDDGKTLKCKYDSGYSGCGCFARVSVGMVPNSGVHTIKFKIDTIESQFIGNAIGITCNNHETNNSKYKYGGDLWYNSYDYIGWSASNNWGKGHRNAPYGLLCGHDDDYQQQNIFVTTGLIYKSNNKYYRDRLPNIKSGDTIILSYDSNKNTISFSKCNDKQLDSCIINLPIHRTWYWIVGHCCKPMSVTIVQ